MKTVSNPSKVVGMYLSDTGDVYNKTRIRIEDKYSGYMPLVNLIKLNLSAELTLSDSVSKTNEIVSYDRRTSGQALLKDVIRSKRLDITQNDVFMTPIRIVLNLTHKDITISDDSEFRKTFNKLIQDKLEQFAGKVVILSLYTVNTPEHLYYITGNGDCYESVINQLEAKNNVKIKETIKVYQYVRDNWFRFNTTLDGTKANSVKVVSITVIDEVDLRDNDLFISELDWLVSNRDIVSMPANPAAIIGNSGIKDLQRMFPDHSFMCYIVDNEDNIGDRYMNVAGHVKRISKIKNKAMLNGLYFADKGSGDPAGEMFCKLEDIDNGDFVYKSLEEANDGANIRKRYLDEIEHAKAQLENTKLESSAEMIRVKTECEREVNKIKAESARAAATFELEKATMERELLERKRTLEETKNTNEIERDTSKTRSDVFKYDMDIKSMRNKHNYETERYVRDSALEGWKTAAATLGVASTLLLVWTKLNN